MSSNQLATPLGPYSHAKVGGGLIYCAGQLALDRATSEPLAHLSAKEQTTVVLDNLRTVLNGFGATFDDVLRTTVYLARLDDYSSMNEAYREAFGQLRPARATLEVSALLGGLAVEIDAVAVAPKHGPNA